jgi:hypothetical protein
LPEWHLPAMAQLAHPQPQELFPAFLSRIMLMIASVTMPKTAAIIRMFAMFE